MSLGHHTLENFLKLASQYHLGDLPTEARHPRTMQLSITSRERLSQAFDVLKDIDLGVIQRLQDRLPAIEDMADSMEECLKSGGKVFFGGCGATGRLSLSVETLWRESPGAERFPNQVVSFMAGGDVALIKSIENFEDYPEFGQKQLQELGFGENDLLIATTEGGETPFVIGAAEYAAQYSKRAPYFLYCNPDNILCDVAERSRRVINNPAIHKINLFVGPMSLAGSTRLQATTILMLAAGLALFKASGCTHPKGLQYEVNTFLSLWQEMDLSRIEPFTVAEGEVYLRNEYVLYETDLYGITVLTDTTERSPTFSLSPFERTDVARDKPALAFLHVKHTKNPTEAWERLLHRKPRPLDWQDYQQVAGPDVVRSFDFSDTAGKQRAKRCGGENHLFSINDGGDCIRWKFLDHDLAIKKTGISHFWDHVLLKMLLNMHSTLLMGRLGRYHGNLMTWVRPSNLKLIDRSIRYIQHLLIDRGCPNPSYEQCARLCFDAMQDLEPDQPVVLKAVNLWQELAHS